MLKWNLWDFQLIGRMFLDRNLLKRRLRPKRNLDHKIDDSQWSAKSKKEPASIMNAKAGRFNIDDLFRANKICINRF